MKQAVALGFKRLFTQSGQDPYSLLKWETRDSILNNFQDGTVVFEQKDVEFPIDWSVNATNIVVQKYFTGTPGTPGRETSLKDLINRVVDTIADHGMKEGYFTDQDETETFRSELKYILATQRAAFNSPVWFNIGAPDRKQQASACFILNVEDQMESILNWYAEEGMIFKGGSGAGTSLSKLRSSREALGKSAGFASGPLSFMRGADSSAGAIKSGGKTRRAAKMVILNVDHPDVEEFIWCKALEERKARVLGEQGFDMSLNGKDIHSIQYQNANNSVRVTDDFMKAVEADDDFGLKAVTTGETIETVKARDIFRQIAEAAWECADPGMQFDTTINDWHTTPNAGRINASNPCSEYMHLDNSACNLASLNLLKFLDTDGNFKVNEFKHTVELVFTAQEILVGYSSYPTEAITRNAKAYRQLGIGYANIGAMLMALGLPYDSDEGRAWAAAITALLTGHSYATSARTAKRMGPFDGYQNDREGMQRVLEKHRDAVAGIDRSQIPEDLIGAAADAWDAAVEQGRIYGVRNAQASVLAPTGTIGLMMDCDTTGIEPDLGLVKVKTLVGGGIMSIVNQTIPRALTRLGYGEDQVKDIIDYIDENKSILGAPHIKDAHLPVFATSMGDNTIHYNGHIRMMGAVQPFISGAISKTVNMPEEVTVEDIEQLHLDSWKLGIKAVAIYRDNCKVAQPLQMAKKAGAEAKEAVVSAPAAHDFSVPGAHKQELPRQRRSRTYEFHIADLKGFFTVGEYQDGRPGELFVNVAKQGSTLSGIMDSFAISISHGLQHGVPLKAYVKTYINMTFAPSGVTDDTDITYASSIMDYIFRRIAKDYLNFDDRLELGLANFEDMPTMEQPSLLSDDEDVNKAADLPETEKPADQPSFIVEKEAVSDAGPLPGPVKTQQPTDTAPLCLNCGNKTQRSGACYVCAACGTTTGCS